MTAAVATPARTETAAGFRDALLDDFLRALHAVVPDNYDDWHAEIVRRDASRAYLLNMHRPYLPFLCDAYPRLFGVYQQLADQWSRDLFRTLLLFRLAGHLHVKLPVNDARYWQTKRDATDTPSRPSGFNTDDRPSIMIRHYPRVTFDGVDLAVDTSCSGLAATFLRRQYFYDRHGTRVAPEPGDHVLDAGAGYGDTALAFAARVGDAGRVYAFDPVEEHLRLIEHNAAQNPGPGDRIQVFGTGVGDIDNDGNPVRGLVDLGFGLGRMGDAAEHVPTRRIDSLVDSGQIERVDFLKMDIEGAELAALRGAEQTIRRFRPRLALSLYHRLQDFYAIPEWLDRLGYRLYLDHYTLWCAETVLYAAPA